MPKQKNEACKSSIELSKGNTVSEFPAYNIVFAAAVMLNTSAVALTPTTSNCVLNSQDENIHIERTNDSFINPYPVMNLKFEDGTVREADSVLKPTYSKQEDVNEEASVDITFQQIVGELREENAVLKRRLENSLPVHAISYIALNSVFLTLAMTLLVLRFAYGIYTVDPYYLICMLIISITLLGTAVISLKDWKKFLNETKRTR